LGGGNREKRNRPRADQEGPTNIGRDAVSISGKKVVAAGRKVRNQKKLSGDRDQHTRYKWKGGEGSVEGEIKEEGGKR